MHDEKWKQVEFPFKHTNPIRLFVSDHGQVKVFSQVNKDGKILKGALQSGYRIIQMKFFLPRAKDTQQKFDYLGEQIKIFRKALDVPKNKFQKSKLKDAGYYSNQTKYQEGMKVLADLKKNLSAAKKEDEKKRTINHGFLVHRLVAENFCRQPSKYNCFVAHLDYHKLNNKFSNLKWMTQDEITEHQKKNPSVILEMKKRKGRRTENSAQHKLTTSKVMFIKKQLARRVRIENIAKQFKVSVMQIHRIKKGENWGDIKV